MRDGVKRPKTIHRQFVVASATFSTRRRARNQLIHCRELISFFFRSFFQTTTRAHTAWKQRVQSTGTAGEQWSRRNLEFHSFQEASLVAFMMIVDDFPARLAKYSLTQHFYHFSTAAIRERAAVWDALFCACSFVSSIFDRLRNVMCNGQWVKWEKQ